MRQRFFQGKLLEVVSSMMMAQWIFGQLHHNVLFMVRATSPCMSLEHRQTLAKGCDIC